MDSNDKLKLGVIAGSGEFPRLICERARQKGYAVSLCAVQGEADPKLELMVEDMIWVKLGELGKLIQFFKKREVREAVLAGKIHKTGILSGRVIPDLEMIKMLAGVSGYKDANLLEALCAYLKKKGVEILDSTAFLKEALRLEGVLTKKSPSRDEWKDIKFGFEMASEIARLDIGQTVVVKNQSVIAVESVEGTDETILRGGRLADHGACVVKVARPKQDMRFDVPTIGPSTLEACRKGRVAVLAFEAGKTIVLHPEKVIREANECGIKMVAYGS